MVWFLLYLKYRYAYESLKTLIWHKHFHFTENESWSQREDSSQLEEETTPHFTVREEEVVIVVLVLAVWVFVIVLFFNKWGKIRMLEPYQPQYHSHPIISKPSRLPLNDALAPLERFNMEFGAASMPYHQSKLIPRRNSTFIGNPHKCWSGSVLPESRMPRKVKSNLWWYMQCGRTLQKFYALWQNC